MYREGQNYVPDMVGYSIKNKKIKNNKNVWRNKIFSGIDLLIKTVI